MNVNAKILFFCMIFVGEAAFGQNNATKPAFVNPVFPVQYHYEASNRLALNYKLRANTTKPAININTNNFYPGHIPLSYSPISANFYTQNFGFFCKKELQVEKITKVPFKFRLGSVQQCDWMEGKPNALTSF
jgi:hypothetical protein